MKYRQAYGCLVATLAFCMPQLTIGQQGPTQKPKTDWVERDHTKDAIRPGQPTPGFNGPSSVLVPPRFGSTYDFQPDLYPDLPKNKPIHHDHEDPTPGITSTAQTIEMDPSVWSVSAQAANTLRNWGSLGPNGWVPPDPHCAAGPNHVIVLTNDDWAIYDKRGTLQYSADFNTFLGDSGKLFDPRCYYDTHSQRFVMLMLRIDSAAQTSTFVVMVSDDNNPLGNWWWYYFDATLDGGNPSTNWCDYEDIGFDQQGVYMTGNMIQFGGGYQYAKIRVLFKSQIYNALSAGWWDFWGMTDDGTIKSRTIRAARSHSSPPNGILVNARGPGSNYVVVWKVATPTGTPSLSGDKLTVGAYAASGDAKQNGTASLLENQNSVLQSASYYAGNLWTAHTCAYDWGSGTPDSAIKYYKIDVLSDPPVVLLDGIYGAGGFDYYYPAVEVNTSGDMATIFNRSSASEYSSIRHSGRRTADVAMQGSALLRAGDGFYNQVTDGRIRWGDYSGISLDGGDESTFWIYGEYGESGNSWGTHLGEISFTRTADVTDPAPWSSFSPTTTTDQTPNVAVNIADADSGLYPVSAQYRYSTSGGVSWSGWTNTACTGSDGTNATQTISHSAVQFNQDTMNLNRVQFRIEDMFGNLATSGSYIVATDSTPPGPYGAVSPYLTSDQTPTCTVTIQDVTSGLDVGSAVYWYTKDAGATYTGPVAAACTGANGTTAIQTISAASVPYNQDSMTQNQIWFLVYDMFGQWAETGWVTVRVDSMAPANWNTFAPGGVVNGGLVPCSIKVQDTTSGLDVSTGEYRYSFNGGGSWTGWSAASCTGADGTTAQQTVSANVPFNTHDLSGNLRVQFRIRDMAANLGTSPDNKVFIDKLALVGGTVTLGAFVGSPAGMNVSFEHWNGGVLLETVATTLNGASQYQVWFTNTGGTFVRCKPAHHLSVKQNASLSGLALNTLNWNVPFNGDGVADNGVDILDLNQVLIHFASVFAAADLDGSGFVDLFDLNIALINFGKVGD